MPPAICLVRPDPATYHCISTCEFGWSKWKPLTYCCLCLYFIMLALKVTEWCHHGSLYDLLHTSEYFVRDSSLNGRLSLISASKVRHSHKQPRYSFRMSNTSSVDLDEDGRDDSRSSRHSRLSTTSSGVNLRDTVALMEEGAPPVSSPVRGVDEERGRASSRTGRASHHIASSRKSSLRPSMRVVVDPSNETVTEVEAGWQGEAPRLNLPFCPQYTAYPAAGAEPIGSSVIKKLKSAASVMQSHVMGFGFGPTDATRTDASDTFHKRT